MLEPQGILEPPALRNCFRELHGKEPRLFSAPGRVNLIGEHTDYNDGFVLPMAAHFRTYVAGAPRDDCLIQIYSSNLGKRGSFDLNKAPGPIEKHWYAYIEGVARQLVAKGFKLNGADLLLSSEVPIGAGLSSSAALEISSGFALLTLAQCEIDLMALALAAQSGEHLFVGTKSGLMDQLTAVFGVEDHAMLIDCRSLDRKLIPLNLPGMAVVVCDTKVKHELATSAYNERRQECEQAVEMLRTKLPAVRSLRDVSMADLALHGDLLTETLRRRCRHVVSESARTLLAADALISGDVAGLGELMSLSHNSLRDDYEVSCRELDIMVELAREQEGVAGSRMMGGGFGGSTVNLVRRDNLDQFRREVSEYYQRQTGIEPTIITVRADEGVLELS